MPLRGLIVVVSDAQGVRNVSRNKARTLAVILIVGLSIGVFLTMSIVNDNMESTLLV